MFEDHELKWIQAYINNLHTSLAIYKQEKAQFVFCWFLFTDLGNYI